MKNAYKETFEKVKMPENLEKEILNMTVYKEKSRKKAWFRGPIAACLLLCVLFGGVVYASVTGLWGNIFGTDDVGLQKSLEYDYVQNVNMDYVMSNGVGFKVENITLDDETFAVVYNLKLDKAAPNFDWVNLADLIVKDENGIVLYGEGKGMIATGGENAIASEDNIEIKISHINNNENHNYPKSKKLYFSMQNANLINSKIKSDKEEAKIVRHLSGNWAFEIDVADKFVNRQIIQYTPSKTDRLKVNYAELTSTGLNMEIEFADEKFSISNRMTLTTDGTVYENERGVSVDDGEKIIRTSFPITIYNATSKMTFVYDGTSIELNEVPTHYSQLRDYLSKVMAKEYEPYYTDFKFVLFNYKEKIDDTNFTATTSFEWTTKEIGHTYMDLQIKGKLLSNGTLDENSLVIMDFNDGTMKYDIPLEDFFPRNNR